MFSRPVVSDSLWPRELQHARSLCPSPSPEVCSSLCPLHWWFHPAISSSHVLFSFCPPSSPASGTFPMSQLFASGDQNTGASASVIPMSIQGWFPLRLTCFDLLAIQGTLRNLLQHSSKASIFLCSAFLTVQLSQPYVTTGKTIALTIWTSVGRVMALLPNTLSRFVTVFLPRNSHLLISLQSPSAVISEPKKRISVTTSTFSPFICHEVMGLDAMILVFLLFNFKQALSLSSFTLKRLFSCSSVSAIRVVSVAYHSLPLWLSW